VHDVFAAEVGDPVKLGDIGSVGDGTGYPAAGVGGKETLAQVHDSWAFVFEDRFIGVYANVELVTELSGLDDGAGMAWKVGVRDIWLLFGR